MHVIIINACTQPNFIVACTRKVFSFLNEIENMEIDEFVLLVMKIAINLLEFLKANELIQIYTD